MAGAISLLILASVIETVAAPPPTPVVAPPPAVTVRVATLPDAPVARFERFQVELFAGKVTLWTGELTATEQAQGKFSQTLQLPAPRCLDGSEWRASNHVTRSSVSLSISIPRALRNAQPNPDTFTVDARWERPLPDCNGEAQATVTFTRPILLEPGKTGEVSGDAGLAVRITRLSPDQ